MNILITNDDGIHSQGIILLARRLSKAHNVFVVAPDTERSGASHSITLMSPLAVKRVEYSEYAGITAYSVTGTPADCVLLGATSLLEQKMDLIISGINLGSNIGTNIAYSGTANAAMEGLILGYPSLAVSQMVEGKENREDFPSYFEAGADIIAQFIDGADICSMKDYLLNINFPAVQKRYIKGVKLCAQGINEYDTIYEKETDVFGRDLYKMRGVKNNTTYNEDNLTDVKWVREGYIAVTPLTWKNCAANYMEEAKCKIDNLKLQF